MPSRHLVVIYTHVKTFRTALSLSLFILQNEKSQMLLSATRRKYFLQWTIFIPKAVPIFLLHFMFLLSFGRTDVRSFFAFLPDSLVLMLANVSCHNYLCTCKRHQNRQQRQFGKSARDVENIVSRWRRHWPDSTTVSCRVSFVSLHKSMQTLFHFVETVMRTSHTPNIHTHTVTYPTHLGILFDRTQRRRNRNPSFERRNEMSIAQNWN